MDQVKVRSFRPEDLERTMDIAEQAWAPIFAALKKSMGEDVFNFLRPDAGKAKRLTIKSHAETHPEWFVVAETPEGKIAGFATYFLHEDSKVGEIGNNAVDKTMGLKGVGQVLYAELLRRFRAAGMVIAQVNTGLDEGHAPARRAYQRAGFGPSRVDHVTYYQKLTDLK